MKSVEHASSKLPKHLEATTETIKSIEEILTSAHVEENPSAITNPDKHAHCRQFIYKSWKSRQQCENNRKMYPDPSKDLENGLSFDTYAYNKTRIAFKRSV